MQRLCCLHSLTLLVFALTVQPAWSQGTQNCFVDGGTELGFENESNLPVFVQVFEADGTPLLSYQGAEGVTVLPDEENGSCDFALDVTTTSGPTCIRACQDGPDIDPPSGPVCGDDPDEYNGYRCFVPNKLMRVVLRIEDSALLKEKREHFSFAYKSPEPATANSFYNPFWSTRSGNQDAHVRYYGMNGQSKVLASVDPIAGNFIEDFIGEQYVMPYNLDSVCAQPGANCSPAYTAHSVFLSPVPYTPPDFGDPTDGSLPPVYTFASGAHVIVPAPYTWDWDETDLELHFPEDYELLVDGDLTVDGATLTDSGSGWGGVTVFEDASLDLDGAAVSNADVGVLVLSDDVTISGAELTDNAVGVKSGYIADYCATYPNCVAGPNPDRSAFEINSNTTITGTVKSGGIQTGIGVFARNTDAIISNTEITSGGSVGLFLLNADIATFNNNDIVGNDNNGALLFANGDLSLKNVNDGPGIDCFTDNTDDEIWKDFNAFLLVGDGVEGGDNAIFDDDLLVDSTYFIFNETGNSTIPVLDAYDTYWGPNAGSGGTPPSGAFNVGVNPASPLTTDPTGGCGVSIGDRTASVMFQDSRRSAGRSVESGGESARDRAWLGEDIRSLRVELRQALLSQSEAAAGTLRRLYAQQRRDRADELGEWQETMALIASVRALLAGGEVLSGAMQEAAEVALLAEVADALRHGSYETAGTLVLANEALVTGERTARSFAVHAALTEEALGRTDEALTRVEDVYATLDPSSKEAEATAMLAAALAEDLGETGARGTSDALARQSSETESRSVAADDALQLLAPYPNPATARVTVPVALAERAEVQVTVFDVLGREVSRLADETLEAGRHRFTLDGAQLPAGVYLIRATLTGSGHGPGGHVEAFTERITLVN